MPGTEKPRALGSRHTSAASRESLLDTSTYGQNVLHIMVTCRSWRTFRKPRPSLHRASDSWTLRVAFSTRRVFAGLGSTG